MRLSRPDRSFEPTVSVDDRQAAMAGRDGLAGGVGDGHPDRNELDRFSRLHHVGRPPVREREPTLGDRLLLGLDQALRPTLGEQFQQLALGVRSMTGLARRGDAERAQNEVAQPVEQIDQGLGRQVEQPQCRRHPEARVGRPGNRDALRSELADHDVQQRDQRERERARHRDAAELGLGSQHRGEQALEGRLADNPQADTGDRDPELAGGEVGVQARQRVVQRA
jgi:hypothetical protein